MAVVTFVDETTSGERAVGRGLEIAEETLTLRELIRRRVVQEVEEYNAREPEVFRGLVRPADAERVVNGYALRTRHPIDPEAQVAAALRAFEGNGFLVLVGDRQVTGLDEEIEPAAAAEVTFLKLVPLVGG